MKINSKKLIKPLLDLAFPLCCPVCNDVVVPKGRHICSECKVELPYLEGPLCMKCGAPVATESDEFCDGCKEKTRSFDRGASVFLYDELMRKLIGDFKFRGHREYVLFFADELEMRYKALFEGLGIQALVPVPVHSSKKRFRGYNQSELLCRELSQRLDLPVYNSLVRDKKTAPQKELDPSERKRNLTDAMNFRAPKEFLEADYQPEKVLVVDDIFTTGATLEACADVLKTAGIDKVYFLCIATGNKIN